jgi:hypothetical protein
MPPAVGQIESGFWLGIGAALAFMVWGMLQMLWHRAERSA